MPEVILAEPEGREDLAPFVLLRWIDGITFRDLKRTGDTEAIAEAAYAAGETLAALAGFPPRAGWIGPGPAVTAPLPEGADPMPHFVDLCLESEILQARMPPDLRKRVHTLTWSFAPQLAALDCDPRLVHGDFNRRNIFVRRDAGHLPSPDRPSPTSAISFATIARQTCSPSRFSRRLPKCRRQTPRRLAPLARIANLLGIRESLSRAVLSPQFTPELIELVRATIKDRDPNLLSASPFRPAASD